MAIVAKGSILDIGTGPGSTSSRVNLEKPQKSFYKTFWKPSGKRHIMNMSSKFV